MPGRDTPGGRDPDDWFAGLEPASSVGERLLDPEAPPGHVSGSDYAEDDWLEEDVREQVRRGSAFAALPDRWVAVVAVVLLALCALVGALVFAGVFGSSKRTNSPTTSPAPPTHPATTAATTTTRAAANVPAPTATSAPGDQGTQVKELQRALASLGHSPGKLDGIYGPLTTAAVKDFQAAAKVTVDGIAGPVTLGAIGRALNNP